MHIQRPLCLISAAFVLVLYFLVNLFPADIPEKIENMDRTRVSIIGIIEKKELSSGKLKLHIRKVKMLNNDGQYRVIVQIPVADDADNSDIRSVYNITNASAGTNIIDDSIYSFKIGAKIKVSGTFNLYSEAHNDGEFDSKKSYARKGYCGYLKDCKIEGISREYSRYREWLFGLRMRCEQIFDSNMNEQDSSVMKAIVLGDKSEIDPDIKDIYTNAGIAHVLSLSGLHIAAVGLFILKILKKTGLPRCISSSFAMFIMVSYAMLTGMSVSTKRALLMFILVVIAEAIGRTYDLLTAAAFSSVIMMARNPYLVLEPGFLLSFLAVIAIGVVYPAFLNAFNGTDAIKEGKKQGYSDIGRKFDKCANNIINSIIASMSIFLTTLPVVASSYYKVSIYSFIANLIVIPLMGLLLGSGFAGLFAGIFMYMDVTASIELLRCASLYSSCAILKISSFILKIYNAVSVFINSLYGNTFVTGKPLLWQSLVYYVLLFIAVCMCNMRMAGDSGGISYGLYSMKRRGIVNLMETDRKINRRTDRRTNRKIYRNVFVLFLLFMAMMILAHRSKQELEIRNLSVGQGDCAVITGKNTPAIIIDGGSTDVKKIGKYRIIPALLANGIGDVDYAFITHLDADHYNGIVEILENSTCGIKVKRIIVSSMAGVDDLEELEKLHELEKLAAKSGCKIYRMGRGDIINAGDISITCLYPSETGNDSNPDSNSDSNDKSLVLRIDSKKSNFSALFTGDISAGVESQLDANMLDCDYLKVAHHGSKNSSSSDFLSEVSPKISVISVGKDNSYGHPHKETLDRFDKLVPKCEVIRTDEAGQISVKLNKNALIVERFAVEYGEQ